MEPAANPSAAGKAVAVVVVFLTMLSTAAIAAVLFFYPIPDSVSEVPIDGFIHSFENELSCIVYEEDASSFVMTIDNGGKIEEIVTECTTVSELLLEQKITVSAADELSHSLNTELYPGMTLSIVRYTIKEVLETTAVPYETIHKDSVMLAKGDSIVWRDGLDGERESRYDITYRNDKEVSRTLLETTLVKDPIDEIVLHGQTDGLDAVDTEAKTITVGGKTYPYVKSVDITATAYTCEGSDFNITYTGTTARFGAIAVDPRIIPLNSKLFVVAEDGSWVYGFATAEDTGGFIRGKRIDLYFDTKYECIEFGRQETTVYILED